ncbi:MAG TPA: hypothetical protein VNC17_11055, partial [Thermoleophilaceae bacterium]|nr:hypothetical protein [Thermoleophilaceae bacterium]
SIRAHAPMRLASDGDDAEAGGGATAIPQSVDDSIFTAQVGALELFLPIRVASDGDSQAGGGSAAAAGAAQTTAESVGTAQVGSVDADLPVRVASDGDNQAGGGSAAAAGAAQTTTESVLTAQVGSVDANLPIRVASDGDNESTGSAGSGGATQTTADSIGTVQIGSGQAGGPGGGLAETVTPLAEVASIPSGVTAGQEVTSLGGEPTDSGGGSPGATMPALDQLADPEPTELVAAVAQPADSPMASSQGGTLPFTGAGLSVLLMGLAFASSGFALRLTAGYRVPVS